MSNDNPFEFDDGDGDDDDQDSGQSNPMNDLRKQARRINKALKEANKELEELRGWRKAREEQDRKSSLSGILKQVGLEDNHAELYLALNPEGEVSLEALQAFVQKFNLPTKERTEDEESREKQSEATTGTEGFFTPAASLTQASLPSKKIWEPEEFRRIYEERPQDALQILREGRVKMNTRPEDVAGATQVK